MSHRLACAFSVLALLGLSGCRSDLLQEKAAASIDSRQAARVQVLEGYDCQGKASVATAPEQCVWPEAAARTSLLSAVVRVVAHVGPDGHADSARLLDGPAGYDFDAA